MATDGLLPADAADEGDAFGIRPLAKFFKFLIIDKEVLGASRTDDRLLAVTPGFAPFEHAAERVAIPFTEMIDDGADMRTQWLTLPCRHPGSESFIMCLPLE
jgi:hypothetical protein